jgi:hypothetical protein
MSVIYKYDLRSMGDDVCVEFKGGVARLYTQGRKMISVPELREFGADYSKLNDYVARMAHSGRSLIIAWKCCSTHSGRAVAPGSANAVRSARGVYAS